MPLVCASGMAVNGVSRTGRLESLLYDTTSLSARLHEIGTLPVPCIAVSTFFVASSDCADTILMNTTRAKICTLRLVTLCILMVIIKYCWGMQNPCLTSTRERLRLCCTCMSVLFQFTSSSNNSTVVSSQFWTSMIVMNCFNHRYTVCCTLVGYMIIMSVMILHK